MPLPNDVVPKLLTYGYVGAFTKPTTVYEPPFK